MSPEELQLRAAIAGLESQRALLGDELVDSTLVPLRAKLAALAAVELADPISPAQKLRQVTVLFLDVVDSTKLAQQLDPEDIQAVMDGALADCTGIVESYGGRVLQYAGDSLLAVFGADEGLEDDPERAVRAGLALLAEGRDQGSRIAQRYGHTSFDVRVGIHTGSVLLGGGVDSEGSIRGMTVNFAARMEQAAPPGTVRMSHETYRHVRGVFDVERQPPITVKGVAEPVVTYLVRRAKPRAFRVATRGIEGVETRMIGRDAELEQLQDALRQLYSDGKLSAVLVVAEAGVGKSRLLYEFVNWAEARAEAFYLFQGRAHPLTQSQPYGLLRDILGWRLQIDDSDSMAAAKQKFEIGIAALFAPDDGEEMAQANAHLLGHLIGLDFSDSKHVKGIRDDAKQIRNRGFHAAAQVFRRVGASDGVPVALLLDDLHWADDASLDFLKYLAQVNRDVPLLMLGLTRPSLFERRSDWTGSDEAHRRIDLLPLDRGVSRLLANELLKKVDKIPSTLRELISDGADGNPFYMEELVKMLVDEGAIQTGGDRWQVVPDKLLATHVPQTLTGVIQARLDGLKPAEKLALQQASVIGFVFWDQALAAIDARATQALPGVTQRELVVPHVEGSLEGAREYAFKHQILHQVTYGTVLKQSRRECHARVADWLANLSGSRANDFLGATAEHFESAGDDQRACHFFTRAAEHAAGRFAHEVALAYVARALALIVAGGSTDSGRLRWRLLQVRERTLDLRGQRSEQLADIAALVKLAEALDDDRLRAEAAWRRSDIAMRMGDFRAQESAAQQAMALAERAGDEELRLRAQQRLAGALCNLGDPAAGKLLAQDGLAAARAQGMRRIEAQYLNTLSIVANMQDDRVADLMVNQQELPIDRMLGDRRSEAGTLTNLGLSWLNLGELTRARRDLEEGLRIARAIGYRAAEPYPLTSLSQLALWEGDDAMALAHARAALDIADAVQDPVIKTIALVRLGDAELSLGRHAEALNAFERAQALALSIRSPWQHDATAGLARVAIVQGDSDGALRTVEALLAHIAGGGTLEGTEGPRLIRLTCHRVLSPVGDPRAAELLDTAYSELLARANAIRDDALRQSFLANIPEHRAIVAAWEAQH